jgi:hypothetical protein
MATVTRQFKEDFDTWAQQKIDACEWTPEEIDGLRGMIRQDLTPGPDVLRQHLTHLDTLGIEHPSMIEDHEERYQLWAKYFADEIIRAVGINQRIRASIAAEKQEAA